MTQVRSVSSVTATDFPRAWYEITAEGHFWVEWRFRAFLVQLDALGISRDTKWRGLDIGCGHGVVRRQLEASTSWVTDGADLNREALSDNRTRSGESLLYDIHERRPEFAQGYDFVVLYDVLEHLEKPQDFLESALYHLKPGGWLFINVPALEAMRSRYDEVVGHLRRYDKKSMRAELGGQALEIRDMRYWGASMLPYLLVRKFTSARDVPASQVLQQGMGPPKSWMNQWILRIMKVETMLLRSPLLGTSLLAAAVKQDL